MTPEELVKLKYPKAHLWWNCLEFDWIVLSEPGTKGRFIGEAVEKAEAWLDAANKIYLPGKR